MVDAPGQVFAPTAWALSEQQAVIRLSQRPPACVGLPVAHFKDAFHQPLLRFPVFGGIADGPEAVCASEIDCRLKPQRVVFGNKVQRPPQQGDGLIDALGAGHRPSQQHGGQIHVQGCLQVLAAHVDSRLPGIPHLRHVRRASSDFIEQLVEPAHEPHAELAYRTRYCRATSSGERPDASPSIMARRARSGSSLSPEGTRVSSLRTMVTASGEPSSG